MSSDAAFTTIEARLRSLWSACPLVFENEDWPTPDEPAHFLLVEVAGDVFDQASIGGGTAVNDNLWREEGQIIGHVMTRRGIGSTTARQLAKQFVDLFRGLDVDGIRFRGASIGAGETGDNDGNYWRMTALLDWERDE